MGEPAKQEEQPEIELRTDPRSKRLTIAPSGAWVLNRLNSADKRIKQVQAELEGEVGVEAVVDAANLTSLDAAGALFLLRLTRSEKRPELINFAENHLRIIELVGQGKLEVSELKKKSGLSFVQKVGRSVVEFVQVLVRISKFVGRAVIESLSAIAHPRSFRVRELFVQLESVLVDAVPIAALVTFLIGVVIAYLFAIQVERYGGNIFIVDAVGMAMMRELSPIIVAIIMAGRSGSAFTAQLGVMKINEEVDALTILGLSPFQVLIVPRLVALVLAMPLLVFVGDLVGIFGGMLVADLRLGIGFPMFIERLGNMVPVRHLYIGLLKAPIFAAFIAIIGCNMGLAVESSARSIGNNTTSTVVQSIVAVILLNAGFAIMLVQLGY